eukprot:CAMPEP_0184544656 /NCGR_PEP_ID=MMETSP0199_2-20130426/3771_1 /TAXON_ID=1112570 /ORGANISM="Thraustochytrium sp., Strain LLF1b" /LENGTH=40 /DNA_ID= /DNA_START= /DNA_END= /DNA_ORIENTATION=
MTSTLPWLSPKVITGLQYTGIGSDGNIDLPPELDGFATML